MLLNSAWYHTLYIKGLVYVTSPLPNGDPPTSNQPGELQQMKQIQKLKADVTLGERKGGNAIKHIKGD